MLKDGPSDLAPARYIHDEPASLHRETTFAARGEDVTTIAALS
jgi:hypothetical protein